jgi:hypothetical protein
VLIDFRRIIALIAIFRHQRINLLDHRTGVAGKALLEIRPPAQAAETQIGVRLDGPAAENRTDHATDTQVRGFMLRNAGIAIVVLSLKHQSHLKKDAGRCDRPKE